MHGANMKIDNISSSEGFALNVHNSRENVKDKVIPLQARCGPEGG